MGIKNIFIEWDTNAVLHKRTIDVEQYSTTVPLGIKSNEFLIVIDVHAKGVIEDMIKSRVESLLRLSCLIVLN